MASQTNLTSLLNFFAQVIDTYDTDNNKAVDYVYLDFQKAFDKVPHEGLMLKVNAHGIQGDAARWIRNWLAEACPIGICITLSGKFPYAPYNYLTNGAGSEQTPRCRSHIVRLQCSKTENN